MEMKRTEFGGIMRDPENLGPLFTDRAKAAQEAVCEFFRQYSL